MALTKRPHRRDRRKVAPNTPGGAVTTLVHLSFQGNNSATSIQLEVGEITRAPGTVGWTAVQGYGNVSLDPALWTFRQGGADFEVLSVDLSDDSNIEVIIAGGRDNAGYLLVAPFIPELTSPNGRMCSGGIFLIPAP